MIVTSLLACGKEKLNTKNESYEGKTGGFYTKQAIENWNSYDEADCTNIEAEKKNGSCVLRLQSQQIIVL